MDRTSTPQRHDGTKNGGGVLGDIVPLVQRTAGRHKLIMGEECAADPHAASSPPPLGPTMSHQPERQIFSLPALLLLTFFARPKLGEPAHQAALSNRHWSLSFRMRPSRIPRPEGPGGTANDGMMQTQAVFKTGLTNHGNMATIDGAILVSCALPCCSGCFARQRDRKTRWDVSRGKSNQPLLEGIQDPDTRRASPIHTTRQKVQHLTDAAADLKPLHDRPLISYAFFHASPCTMCLTIVCCGPLPVASCPDALIIERTAAQLCSRFNWSGDFSTFSNSIPRKALGASNQSSDAEAYWKCGSVVRGKL